jgi:hypothetical protein
MEESVSFLPNGILLLRKHTLQILVRDLMGIFKRSIPMTFLILMFYLQDFRVSHFLL